MKSSVAISIADQGVLSLFNLGLNACLVAYATPHEFGHYVFAATLILLATSIQNAIVATPVAVVYSRAASHDKPRLLAILEGIDLPFRLLSAAAAAVLCLISDHDPLFIAATAWLTAASLARETERNVALADGRTTDFLRVDLVAVAISAAFTVLLWRFARPSVAALAGCAAGSALAVLFTRRRLGDTRPRLSLTEARAGYAPIWRDTRWGLAGAATTEVQNRSYVLLLELARTARDVAEVQAGRLLMGPLPLLVGAWARVARPHLAARLGAGDRHSALRLTLTGLAAILSAGLAFALALWLAWPLLERWLFRGRYEDVGAMTALWTIYTLLMITHMVLSAPLVAALRLRQLSHVTMVTAAVSLLLLLGLWLPVSSRYAVEVMIGCEAVALVWIAVLVARLFAEDDGGDPAAIEATIAGRDADMAGS